ncbi:L-arabinose transport system substrate-binding protein [Microbacterium sp. AK009]|uniref:substrate-binding domain-containing protein n=1 Tax=Microbacterium sp. AK009 TaxID=2723068 RepID=UPI0015C79300|nr:substrate-binding domain-containing protein [Microbacterium sp. AK009]NYF16544.1 L-arabinose transport system substrate-binding protein [Microbacterium sp. AK009]
MQSQRKTRRAALGAAAAGVLSLVVALAGCGTVDDTADTSAGGSDDSTIRIAYIQKQGDQQYFIDQAEGAKEAAAELGAEVTAINVGDDANEAISQLETVISQGYDAIAIVVPDQKIGPQVIELAAEAGIPLVATDDAIEDADGNPAPFVGFDGRAMGEEVGAEAARLYSETDWTPENTRFLSVSKQDLQTCEDRVDGAYDAFTEATGVDLERVIVGSDASNVDSQDQAAAAITGNQGVENWVVVGCNDESETGAVTALQNAGFSPDNIIGVGLGAYLTCKDWQAGVESGNKAALFISGVDVGRAAVEVLVDAVQNGTELPANTIADTTIVTPENWEDEGVVCT